MKADWILIANAAHARLIAQEPGSPMVVLESFEHPQSRGRVGELARDQAGREKSDGVHTATAYVPRLDAKTKEHLRFARQLAGRLESAAQEQRFHKLTVFASSPFLGELKEEFGTVTSQRLAGTHDVDLTAFGLADIEQRVARFARAPG
jgi:protein required for attachment to host cells